MSDERDEFEDDDDFDDDDDFEDDDEVAPEGNRIVGARAAVEHVAKALVDDPDGVYVDADERGSSVVLMIHASPGDMGRLIGKRGRVIQAMRQVGRAAGSTEGVRVTVDVAD